MEKLIICIKLFNHICERHTYITKTQSFDPAIRQIKSILMKPLFRSNQGQLSYVNDLYLVSFLFSW